MTTIAFREGILAADVEITGGGMAWATTSKIFGNRLAMAGVAANSLEDLAVFQAWFQKSMQRWFDGNLPTASFIEDGPKSETSERCEAILIFRNGRVYSWQGTTYLKSIELCRLAFTGILPPDQPPYVAIGSGEKFAMATMACGYGAETACIIAARFQGHTNMQRVETLSFELIDQKAGHGFLGMDAPDNLPKLPEPAPAPAPTETIN